MKTFYQELLKWGRVNVGHIFFSLQISGKNTTLVHLGVEHLMNISELLDPSQVVAKQIAKEGVSLEFPLSLQSKGMERRH